MARCFRGQARVEARDHRSVWSQWAGTEGQRPWSKDQWPWSGRTPGGGEPMPTYRSPPVRARAGPAPRGHTGSGGADHGEERQGSDAKAKSNGQRSDQPLWIRNSESGPRVSGQQILDKG